jgi:GTP-binding protein Era
LNLSPRSGQAVERETVKAHRAGFVAIIGKPNVGKSTLLNAYLGQKIAIVSDKPQTTRARQLGILTRPDAQIVFIDTPGIHQPLHRLGEAMVETAANCIAEADVIVFLVDGATPPADEDRSIAALIRERGAGVSVILALNKCDLLSPDRIEAHVQAYWSLVAGGPRASERTPLPLLERGADDPSALLFDWIALSAAGGYNRDLLLDMIVARLPECPPYYDEETLTDRTEREIAADLIREQVLNHVRQEVPHAVAVLVDEWKSRPRGRLHISATIYVEKESQKGIVIGQGGKMLKAISTAARQEIEAMAGAPVFLEVWVKVNKNWRKKDRELKRLGYAVPKRKT